ncbi:hypothetical protein [Bosea sp. (in: a-proteobacteria)]|uniref:hypothetical protein n=1 Tax=Bosea sp. (in: a-proteobacteria) TaxID=1871050 RepID=UPI002733EC50|nr:hypothetical protein [Bosea sp. (in: a-proteobacteria)]MDP3408067.1 hypothetical protein [Bosea sp. (in: a-proteobacteria)]
MVAPLTRWSPGDPRLTGVQIDANFGELEERIQSLVDADGNSLIASIATNSGGQVVITLTDGRFWAVDAAAPMWRPPVARVAGTAYAVRDTYIQDGSTYLVLTAHVAATLVATDVAAGRAVMIARAGTDREVSRGLYNGASAYPAFSAVYTLSGSTATFYKTFLDVAIGGPAPGTFPWYVIGYETIPASIVNDLTEGKTQAVINAELRAEIQDLKDRLLAASIP